MRLIYRGEWLSLRLQLSKPVPIGSQQLFDDACNTSAIEDDEVVEDMNAGSILHRMRGVTNCPQLVNGHFQLRFVGLVAVASRVVQARSGRHLDVTAHDPTDVYDSR